ncbi:MAG: DUF2325 domain-containing protein [Thermomicrobiales bacterium]
MSDPRTTDQANGLLDLETSAELLLDAASAGRFESELARLLSDLDRSSEARAPVDDFRFRMLMFDVAIVSTNDPALRCERAEDMLSSAVAAGEPAWSAIRSSSRLDEIEMLATEHETGFSLLELLAYSTDAGMRSFAVSHIEAVGMQQLDRGADSRSCERLLHAVGASPEAYRLEADRKMRRTISFDDDVPGELPDMLANRTIALAGGHAQLRVTAAALLQRHGIEVASIPSSREAVRRERDIVQVLQGCDLAVVLVRLITHSTSDQVRRGAARMGVPVLFSNAQSAVSVERQLLDYSGWSRKE